MTLTLEQSIGQRLLLSFPGTEAPQEFLDLLGRRQIGGVTLFRALNVDSPAQVRALTAALQSAAAASGQPPLVVAADQEGGQLMALGDGATPFPGNLALGATGDRELARRAGYALGLECAALGVNLNYAPVCDVIANHQNPVVGTRSFGSDPALAAQLAAAMAGGLQDAGVAACAKHFPGHGDTAVDSHYGTPVIPHGPQRLLDVELPPFAAVIRAGVKAIMTAHIALPAFTGRKDLPATLSPAIVRDLLRRDMGFEGVVISDALDMGAIAQGPGLVIDALAAAAAGVDLLLLATGNANQDEIFAALVQAVRRELLPADDVRAAAKRVLTLKAWLGRQPQPPLEVVGCAEHYALAREIAERAVTLVRDKAGRLPLRLAADARIAAIVPRPVDLTPADTSSYVRTALAESLRRYHPAVDEFVIAPDPADDEVTAVCAQARGYDLVVAGTLNATTHPGQAAVVNTLLAAGVPTVAVALRMPYDLTVYPTAPTYVCTYSIQRPALEALARALFGECEFLGTLPVRLIGDR